MYAKVTFYLLLYFSIYINDLENFLFDENTAGYKVSALPLKIVYVIHKTLPFVLCGRYVYKDLRPLVKLDSVRWIACALFSIETKCKILKKFHKALSLEILFFSNKQLNKLLQYSVLYIHERFRIGKKKWSKVKTKKLCLLFKSIYQFDICIIHWFFFIRHSTYFNLLWF